MTPPDAPELPAGIEWIPDPVSCAETLARGVVPLAWPGDSHRARRWAQVLHGYAGITHLSPPSALDSQRCLISVGDAAAIGRAAAAALGRTHHDLPDLHSAGAIVVPAGGSVLLAAPARMCTFAALHPLLDRWARDEIRVGVLTGLDLPAMTFSLAKILADRAATGPRPDNGLIAGSAGGDVHVDGTTGTARTTTGQQPRLADALAGMWRGLAVDAHGTGSHATMGSFMLCGLTGDRERLADGRLLAQGCTQGHCRAGRGFLDQVLVRELRCRVLGLFVCNAITLAPVEQFPSEVSLAFAALEGYPAATLGLLRQDAGTSATEPAAALRLLASGLPLGTVAAWLSDDAAARGCPTAYLLLGDPDHTQPVAGSTVKPVPWPEERPPRLPAVADHARRPVTTVLTRHGPIPPAGLDSPLLVWDAASETTTSIAALSSWVADTDEAAHLEDTLRALMSATSKRKQALTACLEQMRDHRQTARRLALQGLRAAQTCRRRGRGAPDPVPHDELHHHAHQWATAVNDTVRARAGAFRLWEALEANHHPLNTQTHDACARCGAPRARTELTSPLPGIGNRTSITCPRCGPCAHYPGSEPIHSSNPAWLRPGDTVEISVAVPPRLPLRPGDGLLTVQVQDRGGLTALDNAWCAAGPGEQRCLTLSVPRDLTPDLHRIWVLWVHCFRISLQQIRVPALPPPCPWPRPIRALD